MEADQPNARARLTLGLLAVATLLVMTTETLPVGLLPQMARDLEVSEGRVGLLVTAYGMVVVVGAVPLSAVITRIPARLSMAVVLAVFVVSIAATAASANLQGALVARLAGGAAHAVFYSVSFSMATSMVPEAWRGRAVAVVGAGNALALALGVPAATAVGARLGWRLPFGTAAGALAVITVAITMIYQPLTTGVLIGYGIAGVLALLIVGRLSDTRPRLLLIGTVTVTALALPALWLASHSAVAAVAATALWGSAFGAAPVLWQLIAVRAAPQAASIGPAVVNAAFNVGISLGALGGGAALSLVRPGDSRWSA